MLLLGIMLVDAHSIGPEPMLVFVFSIYLLMVDTPDCSTEIDGDADGVAIDCNRFGMLLITPHVRKGAEVTRFVQPDDIGSADNVRCDGVYFEYPDHLSGVFQKPCIGTMYRRRLLSIANDGAPASAVALGVNCGRYNSKG
jgi:hypothetical protein